MRRTKESQKAHLINELSSPNSNKKIIATRGTKVFLNDYKKTQKTHSSLPLIPLFAAWTVISVILWAIFLKSIISLIIISSIGFGFLYFMKKVLLKDGPYQLINKFEDKKSLIEIITQFEHLFNEEIKTCLNGTLQNIAYLKKFSNQNILSTEQEYYLQSCEDKHLIDLMNVLNFSHKDHLIKNQDNVLEQINVINEKLKRIIESIQNSIEVETKSKSVFSKDN